MRRKFLTKFKILIVKNNLIRICFLTVLCLSMFFLESCVFSKKIVCCNNFTGKIISPDFELNYKLEKDTLNNFRMRLYYFSGIKVADILLQNDSLRIQYLVDDLYQSSIINFYKSLNKSICVYETVNDLFTGVLFSNDTLNSMCYFREKVIIDKKSISLNLLSRNYVKIASVNCDDFKILKNGILPNSVQIMFAKNNSYTLTINRK